MSQPVLSPALLSQVAVLVAVLVLVIIAVIFLIILIVILIVTGATLAWYFLGEQFFLPLLDLLIVRMPVPSIL